MSQGVLFWADGARFQAEALVAISQLQHVWPGISFHLDRTELGASPPLLTRIRAMQNSPFEDTLFMDADTWLCEPVPELFRMLESFDLAVPLSAYREVYPVDAPACFIEPNPGILVWRRKPAVETLFKDWAERFQRHFDKLGGISHPDVGFFHSQPAFREALYHSAVRFAILPDEYSWTGTGYVQQKVRIVHKRPNPHEEAEKINAAAGLPRVKLLYGEVQVWR